MRILNDFVNGICMIIVKFTLGQCWLSVCFVTCYAQLNMLFFINQSVINNRK